MSESSSSEKVIEYNDSSSVPFNIQFSNYKIIYKIITNHNITANKYVTLI